MRARGGAGGRAHHKRRDPVRTVAPGTSPALSKLIEASAGIRLESEEKLSPDDPARAGRILVSIPCYKDRELRHTLSTLVCGAAFPERVTVAVFQQLETADACEVRKFREIMAAIEGASAGDLECIMEDRVPASEAWGAAWARHHIEHNMVAGRLASFDTVLMIDCHTMFAYGWDVRLYEILNACPNPRKTVLSTMLMGYRYEERHVYWNRRENVSNLMSFVKCSERENNIITYDAATHCGTTQDILDEAGGDPLASRPGHIWAAGFSFAPAAAHLAAPLEQLKGLYFGEELMAFTRFVRAGFEVRTPATVPLQTAYDVTRPGAVWRDKPASWFAQRRASAVALVTKFRKDATLEGWWRDSTSASRSGDIEEAAFTAASRRAGTLASAFVAAQTPLTEVARMIRNRG